MTEQYFKHTVSQQAIGRLEEVMHDQDDKGVGKYGTPLDPTSNYNWNRMAEEEMADYLKYRHCQNLCLANAIKLLENQQRVERSDYVELALFELRKCL